MIKRDEIANPESCFNKAADHERIFVLRGCDPAASVAIQAWAAERIRLGKNMPEDDQIREALEASMYMARDRAEAADRGVKVDSRIEISTAESITAPLKRGSLTWEKLVESFSLAVRCAPCTRATCQGSRCPHKEGPLWSPTLFTGEERGGASGASSVTLLVLDVDHAQEQDVVVLKTALAPYRYALHATHSDRPGDRCLRVIVALSHPVATRDWRAFWSNAMRMLGLWMVDVSCRDISRLYYLPSRPGDVDYTFETNEGAPLDVDHALSWDVPA